MPQSEASLARSLLTAKAVRERARAMLALAETSQLSHWRVDRTRLPQVAAYVTDTIRAAYPGLDIPFHARWRHFKVGSKDRWAALLGAAPFNDTAERSRAGFDLAIVSVLLDAGAGADWRYRLAEGVTLARSEGLAAASLDMFAKGAFSGDPSRALRADAARLATFDAADLAKAFQVDDANPLIGLEGRAALIRSLGQIVAGAPSVFAIEDAPRPGGLFDHLVGTYGKSGPVPAAAILEAVLTHLGPIWPSRLMLGGVALGDCWRHAALRRADPTDGLVPFHKLSQWLSYSLIEPLQWAGIEVSEIDALTGLPEYRNGGLFIDLGALSLKDKTALQHPHAPASELVVEWRALTVALLDEIAELIRTELGHSRATLPLAKVLEGGTWAAGRRIARELRPDGAPPLTIISDGTVF